MGRHEPQTMPDGDLFQMVTGLREINRGLIEQTLQIIEDSREAMERWDQVHLQYVLEKDARERGG